MINRIISEISAALSNKLYLSALTLALTLPDTCGKAEEPEKALELVIETGVISMSSTEKVNYLRK